MESGNKTEISGKTMEKIPVTTSNIYSDRKSLLIVVQFTFGVLFLIITNYWYFNFIFKNWDPFWILFVIFLPLNIFGFIYEFVFVIAVFSALILKILKKIHPINGEEGIFSIDGEEFKFYKYRYWISYFAVWLARAVPLPWIDFVIMKMLGSKIGKKVCLYDSWMDIELIEIEDNVMTSVNTVIMSHAVFQDKFIQMKTILKKNSITGGLSIVAPGTFLEEGAILGACCSTFIGQRLESNHYHIGNPALKKIPITKPKDKKK